MLSAFGRFLIHVIVFVQIINLILTFFWYSDDLMLSPLPMCFEWMCVTVCAERATISLHLIVGFVHIVAIVLQCWHLLQKSDNYSNVHIANNNTHQHILKLLSNAFVFKKKMFLNNLTCPSIDYFSQYWYRCLRCLRCEERCTFIKLCFILSSSLFFSTSISCFTFCTMSSYIKNIMRSYIKTSGCWISKHKDVIYQNRVS